MNCHGKRSKDAQQRVPTGALTPKTKGRVKGGLRPGHGEVASRRTRLCETNPIGRTAPIPGPSREGRCPNGTHVRGAGDGGLSGIDNFSGRGLEIVRYSGWFVGSLT